MKFYLCIFSLVCFAPVAFSAEQMSIFAEFLVENQFEDIDPDEAKKAGWVLSGSEPNVYSININVPYADLPVRKNLGPAFFSIAKNGLVKIGISIGDADAGSKTELQLPQENGEMLKLTAPMSVKNTGGDYASGSWALDAQLILAPN